MAVIPHFPRKLKILPALNLAISALKLVTDGWYLTSFLMLIVFLISTFSTWGILVAFLQKLFFLSVVHINSGPLDQSWVFWLVDSFWNVLRFLLMLFPEEEHCFSFNVSILWWLTLTFLKESSFFSPNSCVSESTATFLRPTSFWTDSGQQEFLSHLLDWSPWCAFFRASKIVWMTSVLAWFRSLFDLKIITSSDKASIKQALICEISLELLQLYVSAPYCSGHWRKLNQVNS